MMFRFPLFCGCFLLLSKLCVVYCVSSDTSDLLSLVNNYRTSSGLSAVPTSYWLTVVGTLHAIDYFDNFATSGCSSPHSWSGASTLWPGPCCYDINNSSTWDCSTGKPQQLSNNNYTGAGYENWAEAGTAQDAFNLWSSDPSHNDLMVNTGVWSTYTWRSMGAGACSGIYVLWFSDTADPSPSNIDLLSCSTSIDGPIPNPYTGEASSGTKLSSYITTLL